MPMMMMVQSSSTGMDLRSRQLNEQPFLEDLRRDRESSRDIYSGGTSSFSRYRPPIVFCPPPPPSPPPWPPPSPTHSELLAELREFWANHRLPRINQALASQSQCGGGTPSIPPGSSPLPLRGPGSRGGSSDEYANLPLLSEEEREQALLSGYDYTEESCLFSSEEFSELSQPVLSIVQQDQSWSYQLYEFAAIKAWITEKGTDPLTRLPISLSNLRRIPKGDEDQVAAESASSSYAAEPVRTPLPAAASMTNVSSDIGIIHIDLDSYQRQLGSYQIALDSYQRDIRDIDRVCREHLERILANHINPPEPPSFWRRVGLNFKYGLEKLKEGCSWLGSLFQRGLGALGQLFSWN